VAWLAQTSRASGLAAVPIIGPRNVRQLDSYLAALDLTLDENDVRRLDQVSAPALGVPHQDIADNLDAVLGEQRAHVDYPAVPVV
jgi:diketogulonate reductase-like aldo/keto reductase